MLTDVCAHLSPGQRQARTRWNTHESGAAFDCKKTAFLTPQAQEFIARQPFCVIAGPGPQNKIEGLLVMDRPGFVQTPDIYTCVLRLDSHLSTSAILQRLFQPSQAGAVTQLGLFFIRHSTRERLCVQGTAEPLLSMALYSQFSLPFKSIWVHLRVQRAFFHCPKYIRTHVPGLTASTAENSQRAWRLDGLLNACRGSLSEEARAFIREQVLCFLCTADGNGQCAVNHRGGAPGFLVTLPPDETFPGGIILLPDYKGNGAFEAIGNILETGQAALIIPDYAAQLALSVSGSANVLELEELPRDLAVLCSGAERVVALWVQRVGIQSWTPASKDGGILARFW